MKTMQMILKCLTLCSAMLNQHAQLAFFAVQLAALLISKQVSKKNKKNKTKQK